MLTLDIFSLLAESPASAEQVARACQCDAFAVKALLDYFCAVRLLPSTAHQTASVLKQNSIAIG